MIPKRKLGVTRGPSDPGARLPLWFHVSSVLLCAVAVVLLLVVLGNRVYGSNLSFFALVAVLLALACAVFLHLRSWREEGNGAHDTEREFEAVFEHALDAIVILDDMGVCVDANPAAFAILGAPRSVLIGHSFAQFHEDRQEFDRLYGGAPFSSGRCIRRGTHGLFARTGPRSSCTTRWPPTAFPDITS